MIFNLLSELTKVPDLKIIALSMNDGTLADKLNKAGIETYIIHENNNSFGRLFINARKLFKGRNIDIIHSHRYKENLLAALLSRSLRAKKLITTIHGLPELALADGSQGRITALKSNFYYFVLNKIFDKTVAVSHDIEHEIVRRYRFNRGKIEVIHNGIPVPTNTSAAQKIKKASNELFHIGTVGRMVRVKDFDLFLEVAAGMRKQNYHASFSILGDGPLKEHLIQKAKDLKIDDCVEFIEPMADPNPYYKSLDIYMNTSIHEGIPLSILEAMSHGVPVVAPRVGGIPEIISGPNEGMLVEKRTVDNFGNSCLMLITNKEVYDEMSEAGWKKVLSSFSSKAMMRSYLRTYESLGESADDGTLITRLRQYKHMTPVTPRRSVIGYQAFTEFEAFGVDIVVHL